MKGLQIFIFSVMLMAACSPQKGIYKSLSTAERRFKDNTGFMLYDPAARKTLIGFHEATYFTPASNTKILTLYTALHILGDSVPALRYITRGDSLIFWGTGDPSLLNKAVYDNGRVYAFLQNNPRKLFTGFTGFTMDAWGPGWAWDDYPYYYSAERSPLPVFGNIINVRLQGNRFQWQPASFQNHFVTGDSAKGSSQMLREIDSNQITWFPGKKNKPGTAWQIPFHWSSDLMTELLSDTLMRQVDELPIPLSAGASVMFSVPTDSLYAPMMKESDNFIAEQLLLLCSQKLSDTLDSNITLRFAQKNLMNDFPDKVIWVDGSGLSRYNLVTPRSIVRLWEKLLAEIPKDRLFKLLSTGGQKGTLKNYYATNPPFIFGKTGSLSNQVALSGYLITKKGKVLIFSFMNGNFTSQAKEIRSMMEEVLTTIREKY